MSQSDKNGVVIPVDISARSALEDFLFANVKPKAQVWLYNSTSSNNKEMDSVFFNEKQFELLVDTRGFRPEEVICIVGPTTVEIKAEKKEMVPGRQRSIATTRNYQLPKNVLPQQAICCLSHEGLLLLAVPWQNI